MSNRARNPLLTGEQLATLEQQLVAAERELAQQAHKSQIVSGPAMQQIEFNCVSYLRRTIDDEMRLRETVAEYLMEIKRLKARAQ